MKLIRDIWSGLPFQVRMIFFAAIGVLLILAIVLGQISSCSSARDQRKIERIQTNIKTSEIEANVLENSKREVEANANNANADLQRVIDTDSRDRDTDFSSVKRKWCADHPSDSKCK